MNKAPKQPELDAVVIQRGDVLKVELAYQNEDETPINLTGRSVEIVEASDEVIIEEGIVEILNASQGIITLELPSEVTNVLLGGRSSWFRVAVPSEEDTAKMISPKIWVDIQ